MAVLENQHMKYLITFNNSGNTYTLEPEKDEIHRLLVQFVTENPNGYLTIRERVADEDAREIFRIYSEKVV